jgi:hypothetical protein
VDPKTASGFGVIRARPRGKAAHAVPTIYKGWQFALAGVCYGSDITDANP